MSRRLVAGLLLAILAMALGFWLKWRILTPFDPEGWYLQAASLFAYTDIIGIYIERDIASHPLPYAQMSLEYPPVVGAVMYFASFAPGPEGYLAANYVILALAGLGTVWAIHSLEKNARFWVFAATPPLVLYAGLNWDLLAVFFSMASLALFRRNRYGWSAALLALGVWAKLFPALLLPAMALQRVKERDWRSLASMASVFSLVSIAVNLPFILLSYSGWRNFYDFHVGRPPDGGSLWSDFGVIPAEMANSLSLATIATGVVAIYLIGRRNGRDVVESGFCALALFVLASKVSSPQYHLWLMPFLAVSTPPLWLIGVFLTMDLSYYWSSFQTLFLGWGGQYVYAEAFPLLAERVAVARQLVMALLLFWAVRRLLGLNRKTEFT